LGTVTAGAASVGGRRLEDLELAVLAELAANVHRIMSP
jgi:hypothetical protein